MLLNNLLKKLKLIIAYLVRVLLIINLAFSFILLSVLLEFSFKKARLISDLVFIALSNHLALNEIPEELSTIKKAGEIRQQNLNRVIKSLIFGSDRSNPIEGYYEALYKSITL